MSRKNISLKNYIYLFIIIMVSLGILYYLYSWFITYRNDNKNGLIIGDYIQGINYNDLDNYIVENNQVTLYVFSSNIDGNLSFENKLTEVIVDNDLQKKIIYMDITEQINNGKYNIMNTEFNNTPFFVTFNSGKIIGSYDIKSHNYDIDKIENYLESVGVIVDD